MDRYSNGAINARSFGRRRLRFAKPANRGACTASGNRSGARRGRVPTTPKHAAIKPTFGAISRLTLTALRSGTSTRRSSYKSPSIEKRRARRHIRNELNVSGIFSFHPLQLPFACEKRKCSLRSTQSVASTRLRTDRSCTPERRRPKWSGVRLRRRRGQLSDEKQNGAEPRQTKHEFID